MIDPKKKKTFLYVPEPFTGVGEERVFISGGTDHAEYLMKSNLKTPPEEFWITNTPCPACARGLMAWYSSSSKKAKIHATKFWVIAPNKKEIDLATDCLAKMMYQGFTFVLWDWLEFYNGFLRNEECINVLKTVADNEGTMDALSTQYIVLGNALKEASKRSKDQSWISGVAGKCPASRESKSSLLAMVEMLARK